MTDTVFSWPTTAGSVTSIDGVNVQTGMSPGNVDNAFRALAASCSNTFAPALQNFLAGSAGLGVANGGTGVATITGVVKGNGTAAMSAVANASANGKQFLRDDYTFAAPLEPSAIFIVDEATTATTGTAKRTLFLPYNVTFTDCFIGVSTQSSSGVVTVDVNLAGSTIFSTNPTIGANVDTSLSGTGSVAAVLGTTTGTKGQKLTFDVDAAGTGAKGLQVYLFWQQR